MFKKITKEIITALAGMFKAHHAPREIALGVAMGAFIAILPLYGFHTILCVAAAILVPRANKLAILLGTNISLPPTVATITWTSYDIGRWILAYKNYPPLSWDYFKNFSIAHFGAFYYPLFTGSIVLGVLCAVALYFVTWLAAVRWRRKHSHGQ